MFYVFSFGFHFGRISHIVPIYEEKHYSTLKFTLYEEKILDYSDSANILLAARKSHNLFLGGGWSPIPSLFKKKEIVWVTPPLSTVHNEKSLLAPPTYLQKLCKHMRRKHFPTALVPIVEEKTICYSHIDTI